MPYNKSINYLYIITNVQMHPIYVTRTNVLNSNLRIEEEKKHLAYQMFLMRDTSAHHMKFQTHFCSARSGAHNVELPFG